MGIGAKSAVNSASINVEHLEKLEQDLESAASSKRAVFLKVVKEQGERHVEVVKGKFWNFFARIASFFHVRSYDRTRISEVFQEQLYKIEDQLLVEKREANVDALQSSVAKITELFVIHIQSNELMRNRGVDSEQKGRIVSHITQCKHELFDILKSCLEPAQASEKSDFEEIVQKYDPVLKEFGIDVSSKTVKEASDYFKQNKLTVVIQVSDEMKRLELFTGCERGSIAHSMNAALEGELDRVVEEKLSKGSENEEEWLQGFRQFVALLHEASSIKGAFIQKDAAFFDAVQNQRAVLLMELRAVVLRAEEVAAPLLLQDPSLFKKELAAIKERLGCSGGCFSPERLATVSEDELKTLKNEVFTALEPLRSKWQTALGWPKGEPRKFAKSLSDLLSEYEGRAQKFQNLKKQKETDGFAVWKNRLELMRKTHDRDSLAFSICDRSIKQLASPDPYLKDIQQLVMGDQHAEVAMLLRELLYFARKHIASMQTEVGKPGKAILAQVEKGLDSLERKYSGQSPVSMDINELEQMQRKVLKVLLPLHDATSLLNGGVTWPKFQKYRRELLAAFKKLKE